MIKYIGSISRKEVNDLYSRSRAGIVIYQPAENHIKSQPIKLFEFMAAGLPVIASDFELWKEIVENTKCGICVNPTDSMRVREACEYLLNHPVEAQEMGKRGHSAVISNFCWQSEEEKLINLYSSL